MSAATTKQIEALNSLVNEINTIVAKAKNSKYEHQVKRVMNGVETMVEKARRSGDKAHYSSAIGMLLRRKKFVQNYVR
jgi:hypothetical protein